MRKAYPQSAVYRGLDKFFNAPQPYSQNGNWTKASIVDYVDEAHTMTAPVTSEGGLEKILQIGGEDIVSRMVIVEYSEPGYLDRDMLDLLGSCYDIDPFFFDAHLYAGVGIYPESPYPRYSIWRNTNLVEQNAFDAAGQLYRYSGIVCERTKSPRFEDACPFIGLLSFNPKVYMHGLIPNDWQFSSWLQLRQICRLSLLGC